jgi:Ni/Co efflux regulator RcnB
MKFRTPACSVAAALLSFSTLCLAQPADSRDQSDPYAQGKQQRDVYHYGARGPEWRLGAIAPYLYRNKQYVVDDYRAHNLSAPPRGHQWVQVGSDYALVKTNSGTIVDLLLAQ